MITPMIINAQHSEVVLYSDLPLECYVFTTQSLNLIGSVTKRLSRNRRRFHCNE